MTKVKVYDSETTNSKVKFEDVAGLEEEKARINRNSRFFEKS